MADGKDDGETAGDAGEVTKAGLSLSFGGIKGRSRTAVTVQQNSSAATREAITGFGASGAKTADGRVVTAAGVKIIPRQENTFKVGVGDTRRRHNPNRFLPTPDEGLNEGVDEKFELAGEVEATVVTYGLEVRDRNGTAGAGPSGEAANGGAAAANGQRAAPLSVTSREWESCKLKDDVETLAEDPDQDAYEAMPVEMFGEAMLRGMGWSEGKGIGVNKEDAKTVEYVRRPERLGLGAEPGMTNNKKPKKYIKPGETREAPQDMVYVNEEGIQRHVKGIDDKLTVRQAPGPAPGKTMAILGGRHADLLCEVLALEPVVEGRSQMATVRLQRSDQTVSVRYKDLGERWEAGGASGGAATRRTGDTEGGEQARERKESKKEKKGDKVSKRDRADREPSDKSKKLKSRAATFPEEAPWLTSDIRVKIIDKKLNGGALYLKKGTVVDVLQPLLCDVLVDGKRISAVHQSQLETVVPKEGAGKVLVLSGPHARQVATLLRKSGGAAAVQLLSDFSVQQVMYEEIAEYVGLHHD